MNTCSTVIFSELLGHQSEFFAHSLLQGYFLMIARSSRKAQGSVCYLPLRITSKSRLRSEGVEQIGLATPTKFVVMGGFAEHQNRAGSADRHVPFTTNLVNQLALVGRPYSFRRRTSCSIALSCDRSATNFFSLLFSSSNSFSRRISSDSNPSCFFFQLKYVASEIPGLMYQAHQD